MAATGESYTAARAQLARRARGRVTDGPFVIIPVTDMDRAVRFYTEGLLLPLRSACSTWAEVGRDGETMALEPGGTTGSDLGVGVGVASLNTTLSRVVTAGGAVVDRAGPSARVSDPDGNIVRLLEQPATAP